MTGRGRFVTLEGTDGAGKTTALKAAEQCLRRHDIDFVATREPGGTPLAEEVRTLLIAPREETIAPLAETLLLFAARAQHVETVIAPALKAGRWVLCDRFTDATRAYQGAARGVSKDAIEALAALAHPGLQPDLTLYLDLPPDVARARISSADLPLRDRFEQEEADFFGRVRTGYLALADGNPRFRVVDAATSVEVVAARIIEPLAALVDAAP